MDSPIDKEGTTLRKQLLSVVKQTGITPLQLTPPCEFPPQAQKVWNIYKDGFMKHKINTHSITYQEIEAYLNLTGYKLRNWEVDALKSLDTAYITKVQQLKDNKE